jgi:hypothetical protein
MSTGIVMALSDADRNGTVVLEVDEAYSRTMAQTHPASCC